MQAIATYCREAVFLAIKAYVGVLAIAGLLLIATTIVRVIVKAVS